jgi:multicomponent Na+:H+ antiporter subunit G
MDTVTIILQIIGLIFLWIGVIFSVLGVVGLIRLPDVYCRLHASGKISTLGLCGLLIGAGFLMPSTALKALALGIFTIIASPVATHAIALAAYRLGVPMKVPMRDDLGGHFPPAEIAADI